MINVDLNKISYSYDSSVKTIFVSEKDVPFSTEYLVKSKKGNEKLFSFSHSTGPEFDVDTCYVYKSEDGLTFSVANDEVITTRNRNSYLTHKLSTI